MANEILKRDQNNVPVLGGITDDANQEIRMLRVNPNTNRVLISATLATGLTILPATGTVDDSNTAFTFTQKPSIIVMNGLSYRDESTVGGVTAWTWNAGTLTATLFSPVGTGGDIYGIS